MPQSERKKSLLNLFIMRFLLDKLWRYDGGWDRWTSKIIIIINAYIRKSTSSTHRLIIVVFRIKTTT